MTRRSGFSLSGSSPLQRWVDSEREAATLLQWGDVGKLKFEQHTAK
ncbi:MAG: hypothetical protein N3D11_14760 [Candidatus Sumerlaeia bacterium]|nr:hypothetical protein [Candidatus Sumerlaeia bacterium]